MGETAAHSGLTIGLVHNWPGKKNSELDLIGRMRPVLERLGHRSRIVDPIGFVLDDEGRRTSARIAGDELDLVLNLHYLNPKIFGRLSYTVNWNPLRYLVDDPISGKPVHPAHLDYIFNCFRSHDRVLSAGSGELDELMAAVRQHGAGGRDLPDAALELHTTISARFADEVIAGVQPPTAESTRVFYIGANWEKLSGRSSGIERHAGLFNLLDKSGTFEFYGLEKQDGVPLWENIGSYQGQLPFDNGRSILRESARCGISLVLSSNRHIDSAVASTRVFQAFAAGTVVISDHNPFVEKYFGESCCFFDYGRDVEETAHNILACIEHVRGDWNQARERAEQGRKNFQQRFDLDRQLERICAQAQADLETRKRSHDAAAAKSVAVHYLARQYNAGELAEVAGNLQCQDHQNRQLHVYCPLGGSSRIRELIDATGLQAEVHILPRTRIGIGQTLAHAGACRADFHLWYSPGHIWSAHHLTRLLVIAGADHNVAAAPLFKHFPELEDQQEPTAYLINGLQGCYDWLANGPDGMLIVDNLAASNLLFSHSVIGAAPNLFPPVHFFDLQALAMLAAKADSRNANAAAHSYAVTSRFKAVNETPGFKYCEYNYMPPDYTDGEARDFRLFAMLQSPGHRTQTVSGNQPRDYLAVEETEFFADPRRVRERARYISRHFSLKYYLQNLFRHRPLITKLIDRSHSMLARLLKNGK